MSTRLSVLPVTSRLVGSLLALCFFVASAAIAQSDAAIGAEALLREVAGVEQALDARAGFFLHDLETGETVSHRADARFPLNSTFKLFACAALLKRVEQGKSDLATQVALDPEALVTWSPEIERMLEEGPQSASLYELCAAMLAVSDNTAANLVLKEIGGPAGFTEFMRTLGDTTTRLDRWEPELNEGLPDDERDTTTPRAIAASLEGLLLGDLLKESSRRTLKRWLEGHRVADDLFRLALPEGWSIYDRTGAGDNGTRGIVAVIERPIGRPLVVALYLRDANVSLAERNAAIARIGRAIFAQYSAG